MRWNSVRLSQTSSVGPPGGDPFTIGSGSGPASPMLANAGTVLDGESDEGLIVVGALLRSVGSLVWQIRPECDQGPGSPFSEFEVTLRALAERVSVGRGLLEVVQRETIESAGIAADRLGELVIDAVREVLESGAVLGILDSPFVSPPEIPLQSGNFGPEFPGLVTGGNPPELDLPFSWESLFYSLVRGVAAAFPFLQRMMEDLLDLLSQQLDILDAVGLATFLTYFLGSGMAGFGIGAGLGFALGSEFLAGMLGGAVAGGMAGVGVVAAVVTLIALIIAVVAAVRARRKARALAESAGGSIWDPMGESSNLPPGVLLFGATLQSNLPGTLSEPPSVLGPILTGHLS